MPPRFNTHWIRLPRTLRVCDKTACKASKILKVVKRNAWERSMTHHLCTMQCPPVGCDRNSAQSGSGGPVWPSRIPEMQPLWQPRLVDACNPVPVRGWEFCRCACVLWTVSAAACALQQLLLRGVDVTPVINKCPSRNLRLDAIELLSVISRIAV